MRRQGKRNWFDIATTLWAIALVVVAVTWITAPAFAGRGSRGGTDCMGLCADEGYCDDAGGCATGVYEGGQCGGECREGGEWSCRVGGV